MPSLKLPSSLLVSAVTVDKAGEREMYHTLLSVLPPEMGGGSAAAISFRTATYKKQVLRWAINAAAGDGMPTIPSWYLELLRVELIVMTLPQRSEMLVAPGVREIVAPNLAQLYGTVDEDSAPVTGVHELDGTTEGCSVELRAEIFKAYFERYGSRYGLTNGQVVEHLAARMRVSPMTVWLYMSNNTVPKTVVAPAMDVLLHEEALSEHIEQKNGKAMGLQLPPYLKIKVSPQGETA